MRAIRDFGVFALVGFLAVTGFGCGHGADPEVETAAGAPAPTGLRSQRRLVYVIASPVPIAATPGAAAVAGALPDDLRMAVRRDMSELGLEVERDPRLGYDLVATLSASVQTVGRLTRARAVLGISASGRVIESIDSVEVIQPGDRLASALASDLVEKLARSTRAAEYADSIYGRRLRPLRDTVGSHAMGRSDPGAGLPPLEALAAGGRMGMSRDRTKQGRPELAAPPIDPVARAAAQAESTRAQTLLASANYREAYSAFEQAYILDRDVEPLFGMAESLFSAGARQDALVFYRVYLQSAPAGSPSSAKAQAQVSALDTGR